ncbi:hypothetical protein BHE74_00058254 [Ensete ventricosum]|nr:hypothetical protein BHE74_00058254 [Ensete ventricosum]
MKLGYRADSNDAVGPRREFARRFAEGIGKLTIKRDSDDVVGSRQKFDMRFVEGIEKLARNAKGDRRKEDERNYRKIAGVCES